jgi:hypothetical protein
MTVIVSCHTKEPSENRIIFVSRNTERLPLSLPSSSDGVVFYDDFAGNEKRTKSMEVAQTNNQTTSLTTN